MINNKNILITGGTGSLGKELISQITKKFKPKKLIIFSRDELKQFEMSKVYNPAKFSNLRYFIGDVRDKNRLKFAMENVDFVLDNLNIPWHM